MYWNAVGPRRLNFNKIMTFASKYLYTNESSTKYQEVCEKHVNAFYKTVAAIYVQLSLAHILAVMGPFYAFFFQSIRITPLATNLPFFEKASELEFAINMTLQGAMAFYSMAGNLALEMGSSAINNTISMIPDVIRFDLTEFQHEFKSNGLSLASIMQLRNVYMKIQDFNRYII